MQAVGLNNRPPVRLLPVGEVVTQRRQELDRIADLQASFANLEGCARTLSLAVNSGLGGDPELAPTLERILKVCRDAQGAGSIFEVKELVTRVMAMGATSAGKSTLMNCLVGCSLNATDANSATRPTTDMRLGSGPQFDIHVEFYNLVKFFDALVEDFNAPDAVGSDLEDDSDIHRKLADDRSNNMRKGAEATLRQLVRLDNNQRNLTVEDFYRARDAMQADQRLPPNAWAENIPMVDLTAANKIDAERTLARYTKLANAMGRRSIAPLVSHVKLAGPLPNAVPGMVYTDRCGVGADRFTAIEQDANRHVSHVDDIAIGVLNARTTGLSVKELVLRQLQKYQLARVDTILVITNACSVAADNIETALAKFSPAAEDGVADAGWPPHPDFEIRQQLQRVAQLAGEDYNRVELLAVDCDLLGAPEPANRSPRRDDGVGPAPRVPLPPEEAQQQLSTIVRRADMARFAEDWVATVKQSLPGFARVMDRLLGVFPVESVDALCIMEHRRPHMFVNVEETGIYDVQLALFKYHREKWEKFLKKLITDMVLVKDTLLGQLELKRAPPGGNVDEAAVGRAMDVMRDAFREAVITKHSNATLRLQTALATAATSAAADAPTVLQEHVAGDQNRTFSVQTIKAHLRAHGHPHAYTTRTGNYLEPRFNRVLRSKFDEHIFSVKASSPAHFTNLLVGGSDDKNAESNAMFNVIETGVANALGACDLVLGTRKTVTKVAEARARRLVGDIVDAYQLRADSLADTMYRARPRPGNRGVETIGLAVELGERIVREEMTALYQEALMVDGTTHRGEVKAEIMRRICDGMQQRLKGPATADGREPSIAADMYARLAEEYMGIAVNDMLGVREDLPNTVLGHAMDMINNYIADMTHTLVELGRDTAETSQRELARVDGLIEQVAQAGERMQAVRDQVAPQEAAHGGEHAAPGRGQQMVAAAQVAGGGEQGAGEGGQ